MTYEPKQYNFCGCQCGCPPDQPVRPRDFRCEQVKEPVRSVKVLDTAEQTSRELYENVLKAVQQLELSPEIFYVTEPKKTSPYYVDLPAIIKDERAVSQGKLCTVEEIKALLLK